MPRKLTAYNLFMQQKKREIKAANPSMKQRDVMRAAAVSYRSGKGLVLHR